jgi:hypothetical protein
MLRCFALFLFAAALLTGCAPSAPVTTPSHVAAIRCDDGGDGGVIINGVCF